MAAVPADAGLQAVAAKSAPHARPHDCGLQQFALLRPLLGPLLFQLPALPSWARPKVVTQSGPRAGAAQVRWIFGAVECSHALPFYSGCVAYFLSLLCPTTAAVRRGRPTRRQRQSGALQTMQLSKPFTDHLILSAQKKKSSGCKSHDTPKTYCGRKNI